MKTFKTHLPGSQKKDDPGRNIENGTILNLFLVLKKNNQAKKSFEDKYWGFCVASKERTTVPKKENLNFGAVITLHEIKNVNRIEEFMHACMLRGYIVSEVEINSQINIYESAQQDIKFE